MRKPLNQSYLHLVWATWDRLPLLTRDMKCQAYSLILGECARMNVPVVAIGGTDNHVHLLIHHSATLTISGIVKQIKGSSSHALNRSGHGGWFKWQGAYGDFSVSAHDVPTIERYVVNQEEHHRDRTLRSDLELG